MKISTLMLIMVSMVIAFVVGRMFERMTNLQWQVAQHETRLTNLELINIRSEERFGWMKRIGSYIPLVKYFFNR